MQRGRDSNPRYPFEVYTLSRRAPSTTRPPLYYSIFQGVELTKKKVLNKISNVNFKPSLLAKMFQKQF